MLKDIKIRDPNKGFFAEVTKLPIDLEKQKTITVKITKRVYMNKYKRFYKKTYKYHVHCDLSVKKYNQKNISKVLLNDMVFCTPTRRISKTKSHVAIFN